jgi:hypothetical protein
VAKKRDGGRPKGATDKSRDYPKAVAKMRALQAAGAGEREAARIVGEELKIPDSTLRSYLRCPRPFRLNLPDTVKALTPEEAEEAQKRGEEIRRQLEAKGEERKAREEARRARQRLIDSLRDAERYALPTPHPKKPK